MIGFEFVNLIGSEIVRLNFIGFKFVDLNISSEIILSSFFLRCESHGLTNCEILDLLKLC